MEGNSTLQRLSLAFDLRLRLDGWGLNLNYRRGILRLWVVASFIWLTAVLILKDYSCWWRRGPWCGFWTLSTYLDDALILLGPPLALIVAGQLLFWIISGFGNSSNGRLAQGPNRFAAMIGIVIVVVVCGALIALKQLDDWIPVKHEMSDEEVFGPAPEAANQKLAKCMLQQLHGKPQGAVPYAYMICSK
jgi:hypothetical protein